MVSIACQSSSVNATAASSPRAERSRVGDQRADVVVAERAAEGRHSGPSDRGAAVLDDVEQVLVAVLGQAGRIGEIAWTDQKQRRAPGAAAVLTVAGRAEPEIEASDARHA